MKMQTGAKTLIAGCLLATSTVAFAQTIYQYKQTDATVCFFNKKESQYLPHLMRKYQLGKALHSQIWGSLPTEAPFMMMYDWSDDGNAGVSVLPNTNISIGTAPLNMSYFTGPTVERYDHLFKHEYTHVVMTDKTNRRDRFWRGLTGNKVVPESDFPLSTLWSYLDAPRWYAPRWYQEGIACFMETWLCNGAGRALGGYDEAYFRSTVKEGKDLYSVVGLETEGSTADFQQGGTAYLYGTRFINYLVLKYGYGRLIQFYNRTDDSKTFFASQFHKVYGKKLRQVWDEWQQYEQQHQQQNLEILSQYPVTKTTPIVTRKSKCEKASIADSTEAIIEKFMVPATFGSMSPLCIDDSAKVAYTAVFHEGDFEQIVSIDLTTGKVRKIANLDDGMMYQVAYLAHDRKNQRLIWTDRNTNMRGLQVYDLKKNKKVKHLKYQRLYDICYDNTNDCMYGIMSNQGVCSLIKYDSSLDNSEILYSFPFGVSVGDLDISHDGSCLVASILGTKGQHSLIMFNTKDLEEANFQYTTLKTLDDSNLSQFRFSADDSKLVGFSYYTGVPNIWSLDLESKEFNLLSNTLTGLFAPYLTADSTIYALQFSSDGMTPVRFDYQILKDANAVEYLGQKAYAANPDIARLSTLKETLPQISFGEVYDSIRTYSPLKELKYQGAYPDISGFVDHSAWNDVTPVLGYHFDFYDPLALCSAKIYVGASPWSNHNWNHKFHAGMELKYWRWTLAAEWNPTSFYDLFGPRHSSRTGYSAYLEYNQSFTSQAPFTWSWGAAIAHYGGLDALPLYQNVSVDDDITSFQTASLYIGGSKMRASLGAVTAESGYRWSLNTYSYLASGRLFPSITATWEQGTLLPFGHNNTGWLRATVGQLLGDSESSFGNEYFGGFRNNYVDNGEVNRFKSTYAMPGAKIDQIGAHTFAKIMGDISFQPIRFNNFGALQCYPNFIQFNIFAIDLMTDQWGCDRDYHSNFVSIGAQVNTQLILFTHMRTTLSLGYARIFSDPLNRGEFMISLKLL